MSARQRPFRLTGPKPYKPPPPKEHDLQRDVKRLLTILLPPDAWFTAVDHANKKDGLTGAILKGRGAVSGLPDLWLVYQGRLFLIELKRPGGQVSEVQELCHLALRRAGAPVAVCHSPVEVQAALRGFGIPLRGRIAA